MDLEQGPEKHFRNTTVQSISWRGLTVYAKDVKNRESNPIIDDMEGIVESGECCAIMGPSGSGKTTLLNALARQPINVRVVGKVNINGKEVTDSAFRHVTSFVKDQDAFIGSLTARETLEFSYRLRSGQSQNDDHQARIDALLESFGLAKQADTHVGNGISNGQKRRLAVAKQLVTAPKILFLDEPTSGLDSVASFHIINYLRGMAKRNKLIVICSIHQPSASTFNLFDKLMLLSAGKIQYFGLVNRVLEYYDSIAITIPHRANPSDFLLELVNEDFPQDEAASPHRMAELQSLWKTSPFSQALHVSVLDCECTAEDLVVESANKSSFASQLLTLSHRGFFKAHRDAKAYTFRLLMYTGLALLMGTIWLRLDRNQDSIQLLVNALIVSCGFMAFMAVTYVPAFIEDYQQYIQEYQNGLYGATRFSISNFLVGMPYLFIFSLMFSIIFYWLSNCQPSASAFFTWVMWLFFDLLAAEAVAVLAVSVAPNFVAALVLVALINVLMFATAGTLVPLSKLNAFYKYVFYYGNFQTYVFQGMMGSQFQGQIYDCGSTCQCRYSPIPTDLCHIQGEVVLDQFGIKSDVQGRNIGIMMVIILVYRLASWAVLKFRH